MRLALLLVFLAPAAAYADGLVINSDGTTSRLDGDRLWMQNGTVGRVDGNRVWMPDGTVGSVDGDRVWLPAARVQPVVASYDPPLIALPLVAPPLVAPPLVAPPLVALPLVAPPLVAPPVRRTVRFAVTRVIAPPPLVAAPRPTVGPAPDSEFVTPTFHPSEDEQPPKGPPLSPGRT